MTKLLPLLPLLALALAACAPPDASDMTETMDVYAASGADVDAAFADRVASANDTLIVALPTINDTVLAQAIVDAADRGVDVEVVTDVDRAADAGVLLLQDAGVDLRLADGAVNFHDFGTNTDADYASADVLMTHAFVVADRVFFTTADAAGAADDDTHVVLEGHDEDLAEDLHTEFVQVHGGTDASALDTYSANSKSIADIRWIYGTATDTPVELWLGPQERPIKRVIDAVYGARASIKVLTDDFADEGLATALEAKAKDGFDVQVVVGPHFGDMSGVLSKTLTSSADVAVTQVTEGTSIPTIVLIDDEKSPVDGRRHEARAFVLTMPLYSAARTYRGDPVRTDQFSDSALWVFDTWDPAVDGPVGTVGDLWQTYADAAEAM